MMRKKTKFVELPIIEASSQMVNEAKQKICSPDTNCDDTTLIKLKKLRYQLTGKDSIEEFLDCWLCCWDFLSSTEARSFLQFQLPMLHRSRQVISVLTKLIAPIFGMKLYFKTFNGAYNVGTGESTLITGPVGVGKTTLLMVVYVISSLFLDHVIPCYVDYSKYNLQLPSQNISLIIGDSEINENLLGTLTIRQRMVVFLADEIQVLYSKNMHENELEKAVIEEIAGIGKAYGHIGIATGSSINSEKWAMHPNDYGFDGYMTLNNSVYTCTVLHPIRDKDTFTQCIYIIQQQKQSFASNKVEDDDEYVKNLFILTGGVGRQINKFCKLPKANILNEIDAIEIPKRYHQCKALQSIFNEMILNIIDELKSNDFNPWISPYSLSLLRVEKIYKVFYDDHHWESHLNDTIDESILLFHSEKATYEVIQPGILLKLYKCYHQSNVSRIEMAAFEGTLTGWSADPNRPFPSAGHRNEQIVRRYLASTLLVKYNKDEIFPYSTKNIMMDCTYFYGKIIQGVANFVGIDGFAFEPSEDDPFRIFVTVTQIKTNRLDRKLQLGTSLQPKTLKGILKGIENGIEKLMKCVDKKYNLEVKQVYFVTTAFLPDNCIAELSKPFAKNNAPVILISSEELLESNEIDEVTRDRIQAWQSKLLVN